MKPQLTMSSPKSGSMTLRSASRTSASFEPSGAEVMEGEDSDAWRQGAGPRRRDHARPPTRRPSEEPGADADAAREARGARATARAEAAGRAMETVPADIAIALRGRARSATRALSRESAAIARIKPTPSVG